jgi:hypothetical protein
MDQEQGVNVMVLTTSVFSFIGHKLVQLKLPSTSPVFINKSDKSLLPWPHGLVVSSLPVTEETGAMGREIEARQGIG